MREWGKGERERGEKEREVRMHEKEGNKGERSTDDTVFICRRLYRHKKIMF